eukprot:9068982-Alexandrium_andersonii.AAC.1
MHPIQPAYEVRVEPRDAEERAHGEVVVCDPPQDIPMAHPSCSPRCCRVGPLVVARCCPTTKADPCDL